MDKLNYTALRETICHSVLSNGLNIYVDERPEYGKQFAFFATRYGGMDLRFRGEDASWIDTPQGVAHFLEHKMFDTKDGSALQRMAAQGVDPNAYTTPWMTGYFFEGTQGFGRQSAHAALFCLPALVYPGERGEGAGHHRSGDSDVRG